MISMVERCVNYDMFEQGDIQVEAEQLTDDAFYEWLCKDDRQIHSSFSKIQR